MQAVFLYRHPPPQRQSSVSPLPGETPLLGHRLGSGAQQQGTNVPGRQGPQDCGVAMWCRPVAPGNFSRSHCKICIPSRPPSRMGPMQLQTWAQFAPAQLQLTSSQRMSNREL